MKHLLALVTVMTAFTANAAAPKDTSTGEQHSRELYKELVETNTSLSVESVRTKLEELVADTAVKVTLPEAVDPVSAPPPLTPALLGPIEKLTAQFWPGVPVLPILQAGATDGRFTNAAGIPTYGVEPIFVGPDLGHIHGLNEYVGVQSLLEGREFLYRLVRTYAEQK